MKKPRFTRYVLASVLTLAFSSGRIMAQTAPAPSAPEAEDEPIVLSPFVVDASEDRGSYQATSTLAGSRVKTDLKDIASSLSVVTADFLRDVGARNNQDLLIYTTNTEVGGVYGNYAGVGGTFIDGASESSNFLKPSQNTRVRGLDSADNTRDLFPTDIPWDSYTVGRVDLQRGPNSILFGFGSPAGIINASLNTASLGQNSGSLENRLGSYGSLRTSLDYNYVVLPDELAVRFAVLDDETKYRQEPAFNHDQRQFGALRWSPRFLNEGSSRTTLRVNYEHGNVNANRPRSLPPWDRITPYFDPAAINKQSIDPYYAWESGTVSYASTDPIPAGIVKNPWITQSMAGMQGTNNPVFVYDNPGAINQASIRQSSPGTWFGVNSTGGRDGSIDGFPYGSNVGIATYREAADNARRISGNTQFPAADKGFYKTKSIADPSIFDFYHILIDGPNKREWQNWDAYNIALEQLFFDNKLGVEVVYDRQKYDDGQSRNMNDPSISVDIRENLMVYPWAYSDLVVRNPNVGRAYVGGNGKNGGNSANLSDRENIRATVFGDIRADDYLARGLLTKILGRHVVTGVYAEETYKQETRNWVRYAMDRNWSNAIGTGGDGRDLNTGSNEGGLSNGDVNLDWVTYLSNPLQSESSASGLNLPGVIAVQSPHGSYAIPYFDSHWNSNVDPGQTWFNPARELANDPPGKADATESDNVRNYVGWVTDDFNVLNADRGDINRLYTDVNRIRREQSSKAFTWQAYLWEDTLVGTWGWRKDTQKLRSGSSASNTDPSGVAQINPGLDPLDEETGSVEGTSRSWGLVLHTPKPWRGALPWGTNVSLTYSDGRNSRVENRYSFSGNPLPNAKGKTSDIGVVINTLNDRLQFKITRYKTEVADANLSSVTTEASTLGNNTYYLRNLEGWGTATAMAYLRGMDGGSPGAEWFWNWALIDSGWDSQYNDPTGQAFLNHPSTVAQKAAINSWLTQLQPQSWFDAYGFNINYAAAKAGDYMNAFPGWAPSEAIGGVQPSGGGRINGTWPTGTANNESEGYEFEIVGRPTKNWNVSINASKTRAAQTALGQDLVDFIEAQYAKYQTPAGDLRLWWGGGDPFRTTYTTNIWSAYQFQLQTNGKMMPEMAPWRVNLVTNYSFDEGALKGVNVGMGYRWQDGRILGYMLNEAKDNLDVERPYWSDSEDYVDFWAGYERKLTSKIGWRVQVNVRNVGKNPHLLPISVQPDGSPAAYRIQEGMTWSLTNTFTF